MSSWIADMLVRHRWSVLAVLVVITAVLGVIATGIRFDFTPQAVIEGNDEMIAAAREFKKAFGHDEAVIMVVLETGKDGDVLERQHLTWQGQVTGALSKLQCVRGVVSLSNLRIPRITLGVPTGTGPLVGKLPVDDEGEALARAAMKNMKLTEGLLISSDQRMAAIIVSIDPGAMDLEGMRTAVKAVDETLRNMPPPDGSRIHVTGLPAIRVDIVKNLTGDLTLLLPLAGLILLVVLTVLFRRISGSLVPLAAVAIGLGWTVGILVLADQSLNIISNVLPILLFVIGMSNCVHIVCRYAEESHHSGHDRPESVRRTMSHMAEACFLTSLTTAVGFASLIAARSDVLRAFGWQAVLGMGLLYITTIALMATLLPSLRAPGHMHHSSDRIGAIGRIVGTTGYFVANRPMVTLLCSALLVAGCLFAGRNIVVNSGMIETYEEDHPTIQSLRAVENGLSGILPLDIDLRTDTQDRFLQPDIYRKVAELQAFASECDGVLAARSYVDLHQEIYVRLGGDEKRRTVLPDDGMVGRTRLAATSTILSKLGPTAGINRFVSSDGSRARIMLRLRDVGTRKTLMLIEKLEKKAAELFPSGGGVTIGLTGASYVNARAMDRFVRDIFVTLLCASLVIFGVIALLFKSFRLGLITIPPNLMPLIFTIGYMGVRGYDLNAANVIVFAISLGIAVDNTIHFLARFREEIVADNNPVDAIRRSYHGTGRAIVLTSVLIVAGLSILLLSNFLPSRRFAELTSITMIGALVGDLLILPACLAGFWKAKPA